MAEINKNEILEKAKLWWRDELAVSHRANTMKTAAVKEFTINPFLWTYLAFFLEGNKSPESLAKVLIYPRVLGTSINTTFGNQFQIFITRVFEGVIGSTTPGIDLEFIDKVDKRKKYCQLKAGPNVINSGDVTPIKEDFRKAVRLARTNNLTLNNDDFMLCLLYGESWQTSGHIKKIKDEFPVVVGADFWHRFTGDPNFYSDLVNAIGEVANEFNMKDNVNQVIKDLALDIDEKYPDLLK
jgi:hypothetical protein